ncbi:hypothetical protein GCK72_008685 [Caenorhabditis remanei]|uniref:Domain of unknown function WSN domain-containing protein n=1 Tax=Caenorhabditis remanei TaxID=31234 RepID=A0A6A5H0X6_CAERE|nr:hypothetical protein GCK72_008685 [Caenorhabditis remanei]KAF1760436.1 hypothetical protein GCK72_008685 [Caenorhabditis remanei]
MRIKEVILLMVGVTTASIGTHDQVPSHPPLLISDNHKSRFKRSSGDTNSFDPADFGNISSRRKRSSNDTAFSTLQSHISALARVVTGISLYNGLVDNSISSDQAITELMNLGLV